MAFIPYVSPEDGDEELKRLQARFSDRSGAVDHILWVHGPNPKSMELHYDYYAHIMRGPSPVSRIQREMIAVSVSAANDCFY